MCAAFSHPTSCSSPFAHTAKSARNTLSPACFASHELVLRPRELSVLATLPSPSVDLLSFHSRVLSDCALFLSFGLHGETTMRQALSSLRHFPVCRKLTVDDLFSRQGLRDPDLYALLHQPTTLSCRELLLDGFRRRWRVSVASDGCRSK